VLSGKKWAGTTIHLMNIVISMAIALFFLFYGGSYSLLSCFCMGFSQFGLIYDNGVAAIGKFIGEKGHQLRILSKGRMILHGVCMPLLAIPITEVASFHGTISDATEWIITTLLLVYATYELFRWFAYDVAHLTLIDMRTSKKHQNSRLAGSLSYTSGLVFELVFPCVGLIMYELIIGSLLLLQAVPDSRAGILLIVSALLTLLSCGSMQSRPDIQLYGENFHSLVIWGVLTMIG
jgi:hypothetical protein